MRYLVVAATNEDNLLGIFSPMATNELVAAKRIARDWQKRDGWYVRIYDHEAATWINV